MSDLLGSLLSDDVDRPSFTVENMDEVMYRLAKIKALLDQQKILRASIEEKLRSVGAIMGLTDEEISARLDGKNGN